MSIQRTIWWRECLTFNRGLDKFERIGDKFERIGGFIRKGRILSVEDL